jgi:hypothetical protein
MKGCIVLFLALALTGSILAQTNTDQGKAKKGKGIYLGASAGVSFPVGSSYPGTDVKADSKSGYAGTGFYVQVDGDWPGKNLIGLGAQYTYQRNPILASAENVIREGNDTTPLGSGAWSNHYLLAGPVLVKQLNKFQINAKLALGVILSFSPAFRYYNSETRQTVKDMAFGFGYGLKVGFGYSVTERFSLMVNISYLGGSPKLSKEYNTQYLDTTTNTILTSVNEISIKKIVSTINIGAGAAFKF